ncbi:MAG: hypothetical protein WCJ53_16510, partial [Mycobacteriaceae bacterium]
MVNPKLAPGRRVRSPYAWLGAGALGVGVWAALAGSVGVANADNTDVGSRSAGHAGRSASAVTPAPATRRSAAATRTVGAAAPRPVAVKAATTGGAATTGLGARVRAASAAVHASATWQPGSILTALIGNGTPDHPNAGILAGTGYSYT